MKISQPIDPQANLMGKIQHLEQTQLDNLVLGSLTPINHLANFSYSRILSIANFWDDSDDERKIDYPQYFADIIAGLYASKTQYTFLILCDKITVKIFAGINTSSNVEFSILTKTLEGILPGIQIEEISNNNAILTELTNLTHIGALTGIPTNKITEENTIIGVEQIERLLRGLMEERWAFVVTSNPIDMNIISSAFNQIAEEIKTTQGTVLLKGTVDESNRLAQYYIELLEASLQRFKSGKSMGMWATACLLLSSKDHVLSRGLALLKAIFSGKSSIPQPIRIHACQSESSINRQTIEPNLYTLLNSNELATLTLFPRSEIAGYSVRDSARFDVAIPQEKGVDKPVAIGVIVDQNIVTEGWLEIALNDFVKHGLIVGVTGSGKTNTSLYMLDQIGKQHKIPFLVIEPAKSEYRDLAKVNGFEDIQIFTLGDETVSPFRMNPFEIQPGVHIQTHIDFLKSLFFASFVLYAPMPYILEQGIHEVYEDRGWDLARNANSRGTGSLSFPTLTDLYYKVEQVVNRLGYDERITMDVQAGLKARINNLRIGGKGLMLDTRKSIKMDQLLSRPTILELKQIGDDEEKAFLIGLIMMRLYEYREAQMKLSNMSGIDGLQHVTIIEEAHRLLKNVPTEKAGEESTNNKGKAIEVFSNILSEIRAYGEGMLVAEQIPIKLAPDVIKNSNLKVMHRIVALDDREAVGATMNLDEKQTKHIVSLECGRAAAFFEGADNPYLIQVPNYKGNFIKNARSTDADVSQKMQTSFHQKFKGLYLPFDGCIKCQVQSSCSDNRNIVKKVVDDSDFQDNLSRLWLSLLEDKKSLIQGYSAMLRDVRRVANTRDATQERYIAYCTLLHALQNSLDQRGALYDLPFVEISKIQHLIDQILYEAVFSFKVIDAKKIEAKVDGWITQFVQSYRRLCKKQRGPFSGCASCKDTCIYRFDVQRHLKDPVSNENFAYCFEDGTWDEKLEKAAQYCIYVASKLQIVPNDIAAKKIAVCYAVQKAADYRFSHSDQLRLVNLVLAG